MSQIEVKNLTKVYTVPVKQSFWRMALWPKSKNVVAVDGVSITIEEGESVALLGPNGAGKTTTLKMLTGLMYPSGGEVRVMGENPVKRNYDFLSKIALVMGNKNGLSWDLSANQNYELFKAIYRLDEKIADETISQLAQMLQIADHLDVPVRKLSLGQRLKAELIGAILHKPKILFLDEPTLGLDVIAKRNIRGFLKEINKKDGCTLILTSHDMADIEQVSDRVVIINHGKVVFDGSVKGLTNKYRNKKYLTIILASEVDRAEIEKFGKIVASKKGEYTIEIESSKQAEILGKITEKLPIEDIDIEKVPLEEILADIFDRE